jgi:tetratricopeptide (TPR) repeat protein
LKWDKKILLRGIFVCVFLLVSAALGLRFAYKKFIAMQDLPEGTPREQVITNCYRFSKSVFAPPVLNAVALKLGIDYAKKKQYSLAKKIFEEVLASEPTNASVLNNLAFIAGEENDLAKYLRTSVMISGSCAECMNNLGSVLFRQNKPDEARKMFEDAAKLDPKYIDPRLNLAMLLEEKAEWSSALEMYRQAEPHIIDAELKRTVNQRSSWMAEIAQNSKRNVAQDK